MGDIGGMSLIGTIKGSLPSGFKSLSYREVAMIFAVLFLSVLCVSTLERQTNVITLSTYPSVAQANAPFVVTASVKNIASEPHTYDVKVFVDGAPVLSTISTLDAASLQSFTYTRAAPAQGAAVRIFAEVVDLDTGAKYSDLMLFPQSPPETWMSFSAFSSFATSLTSTSTSTSAMSSTFTIAYYQYTMGLSTLSTSMSSTMVTSQRAIFSPLNAGLAVSISLIGLLIFLELTDPSYGKLGRRLAMLRGKYGLLVVSLFLVFVGMIFTRIVMILG
jgi:hypothetical protein